MNPKSQNHHKIESGTALSGFENLTGLDTLNILLFKIFIRKTAEVSKAPSGFGTLTGLKVRSIPFGRFLRTGGIFSATKTPGLTKGH